MGNTPVKTPVKTPPVVKAEETVTVPASLLNDLLKKLEGLEERLDNQSETLEEVKAQSTVMSEDLKETTFKGMTPEQRAWLETPVPIFLVMSKEKMDDVTVTLNGRNWVMQRGVQQMVPRAIADILNDSMAQDMKALIMQRGLESKFNKSEHI